MAVHDGLTCIGQLLAWAGVSSVPGPAQCYYHSPTYHNRTPSIGLPVQWPPDRPSQIERPARCVAVPFRPSDRAGAAGPQDRQGGDEQDGAESNRSTGWTANRRCGWPAVGLREFGIEPNRAADLWWKRQGSGLKNDRMFGNRRRVLRQLGAKGRENHQPAEVQHCFVSSRCRLMKAPISWCSGSGLSPSSALPLAISSPEARLERHK